MTQSALPFGKRTEAYEKLLPAVLDYLSDRGWVSAKQLAAQFSITDRGVRAIASLSKGQIISGQKGYCAIWQASVEDANHAAAWLEHQGEQMKRRAYQIRQAMHQRQGAA